MLIWLPLKKRGPNSRLLFLEFEKKEMHSRYLQLAGLQYAIPVLKTNATSGRQT